MPLIARKSNQFGKFIGKKRTRETTTTRTTKTTTKPYPIAWEQLWNTSLKLSVPPKD